MSTNTANKLLHKYHNSDCSIRSISRIAGQWKVYLSKKPDQYTEFFLSRLFNNAKLEVVE